MGMFKMKRTYLLFSLFVVLVLLAGCAATDPQPKTDSIFDEIVLDGEKTNIAGIQAGMSVDEVLKVLNLTKDDVTIDAFETSNVPGVSEYTNMFTDAIYQYDEFGTALAFRKMFVFHDDKLVSMTYNSYIENADLSKSYDLAFDAMNAFIKKTGAKPVETGTEFEYNTYGSSEKDTFTSAGGRYACQFFHGGVLGEIGFSSFSPTPDQGYAQDVMIQLGISLMLDRIGQ
jgi:hypothetical protein